MESFWAAVLLAGLSSSVLATGPGMFEVEEPKLRTIGLFCKYFCKDSVSSYSYSDYSGEDYYDFWRALEDKPRIFCKLCKKKHETQSTTAVPGTTGTSTVSPSTTSTMRMTTDSSTAATGMTTDSSTVSTGMTTDSSTTSPSTSSTTSTTTAGVMGR